MIFLVEDDAHKFLLRFFGVPRKNILAMGSKGNVIRRLNEHPGATGIVDEDPGYDPPHEFANYRLTEPGEGVQLQLRTRQGGGQSLIVLCPEVEDWLLQRARISGVDPKQYHLRDTAKELHDLPDYEKKESFHQFLAALTNNSDKGMCLLRQWIFQGA